MSDTNGLVKARSSPYFGLDYYQEEFGAWFFGREAECGKIITNLRAARLTLLHAESGVGKSSLLRAGVAWRMRRLADESLARRRAVRSIPVVFSSWKDDPVPQLVNAIDTAIKPYLGECPEPELPGDRLDTAIETASGATGASLLIMLDQFEEYFLYWSREPTPQRFADQLAACVNRADLRANFLIAIREDAYAGLGDLFKGRMANVYGNYLHIEYLDRHSAEEAIRAPLDIYNGQPEVSEPVSVQDELVQAVLEEVRAYDGADDADLGRAAANGNTVRVSTPLLQLVMETVWQQERAEKSHELRLSTLQNLRGVRMIVDTHLGKALGDLTSGERQTAIDLFDQLVTPSGGKIAESVPDLAKRTDHREDQVGRVLAKLDESRIVRSVPAAPGQDPVRFRRYEIYHDVLASTINNTIAARDERRRVRRLWGLTALVAGLLIVALAVVGVFVALWRSANAEKLTAESHQLAAEAEVNAAPDPELGALLALQALHLHDTSQAEDVLRAVLPDVQEARTLQDGSVVLSAAFDPADRNKVASADKAGAAWIWDVKTGRRMRLSGNSGFTADDVAFNPAGSEVAVGYGNGKLVLFSARTGVKLRSINVGPPINDARFVGSTGELAIATPKGVAMWRPDMGSTCCDIVSSTEQGYTIAADPANPLEVAVATESGTVIWTLNSGSLRPMQHRLLDTQSDDDAEFSPDGKQMVIANASGTVSVYDLGTFKKTATLAAGESPATSAAFSRDGKLIVAGYLSGTARVWDATTGLQMTLLFGSASDIMTARFSADASEVVTASEDGTVRVWRTRPRELRTWFASSSYGNTPNPAYGAEYSPRGDRILTYDSSGNAQVFTASGQPVYSGGEPVILNPGQTVDVKSAQFNHAGTEVVTADSDGSVDLWHATGSDYSQVHLPTPIHLSGPALYASFSPDGSRIAVVTNDDTAQVRSARTGQLLWTLNPNHQFSLSVAVFSPDGRQILTGDDNGQVEVWNAATGRKIRVVGVPGSSITDVEYNKSGSKFVTAANDGAVTIWAAGNDKRSLPPINACPSPSTASFSPDGNKIVVACENGGALVFDATTGQQLTVLQAAGAGSVNSAQFSPDGGSIVTAFGAEGASSGVTGGVRIWSTELATRSLTALERVAAQRITRQLTPAERRAYLAGISG